jgi:Zn-dependent protease with chaperone function
MHLLTQSALLQALGWSLFNSIWQMGLLWLLYRLLVLIFNDISARIRHGLAVLLLAAGTLWSGLSFVSTYILLLDGPHTGLFPFFFPIRSFIETVIPFGSSLYLLILAGLLIRYCYQYFYSKKLTRAGLSRIQPELRGFVAENSRRMGIRPVVKVWLSKLVDVPVTLGFLKPVILIPLAMAGNLTPEQVEAILIHELAHVRRKDFLLNLVVTMLEGLFFFNPFVRWLIADLKKEREFCCDDLVLHFRYDPHTYVSALLALARQAAPTRQAGLALAATGGEGNQLLLQRAKRILQQRTDSRSGAVARPFALVLLTFLITLVTLSRPARSLPAAPVAVPIISNAVPASPPLPGVVLASPPVSHLAPPTPARHAIHSPRPAKPAKGDLIADDQPGEDLLPLLTAVANADGVMPDEWVAAVVMDNREYSIGKSRTSTRTRADEAGQPFVPKSSFSFLSIEEDTLRPEEKLARVQLQTQREIALNMQKLQRALIEEQLRLQKSYMQQLDQLQKKLKKVQRRLTIVYI